FNPTNTFNEGTEKDWPSKIGMLDWDKTRIVFTKRTLIEFLRYTGTSVDPNFHNIAKLPRYADIGKMDDGGAGIVPGVGATGNQSAVSAGSSDFKPTRRVRTVPGGPQSFSLGDGSDDLRVSNPSPSPRSKRNKPHRKSLRLIPALNRAGKSLRVRTGPGGPSSMSNLWDDVTEEEAFKPTRRVREGPGGADHISQIF
ncbi:hypothetical protein BU17DRAFT_44874, partial [Hysterangium stoloniferum]